MSFSVHFFAQNQFVARLFFLHKLILTAFLSLSTLLFICMLMLVGKDLFFDYPVRSRSSLTATPFTSCWHIQQNGFALPFQTLAPSFIDFHEFETLLKYFSFLQSSPVNHTPARTSWTVDLHSSVVVQPFFANTTALRLLLNASLLSTGFENNFESLAHKFTFSILWPNSSLLLYFGLFLLSLSAPAN